MSTDRQRVKRAIQRIAVQAPELQSFLNDAESKGGKAKSAGVGSSSEAQGDRVCCDGSVGGANPGTGERDPDAPGAGQDGLNGDDPADLTSGDGTLSGVTDCATGEPVCFDGAGFIPPDGWDEPDDPPVDPTYIEGSYYYSVNFGCVGYTATDVYACLPEELDIFNCVGDAAKKTSLEKQDGPNDNWLAVYVCIENPDVEDRESIQTKSCSFEPSAYCDPSEEDIQADSWPTDGCVNLAIQGGKIVGSKFDPENDGSYSAPRDSIDLCSGGDQISLAPAANGGWKTINSTTDNGYLYDSSGKQIAHIDGNEYSDPNI